MLARPRRTYHQTVPDSGSESGCAWQTAGRVNVHATISTIQRLRSKFQLPVRRERCARFARAPWLIDVLDADIPGEEVTPPHVHRAAPADRPRHARDAPRSLDARRFAEAE